MTHSSNFDLDSGQYVIKIPQLLWNWNKFSLTSNSPISIESHLSRRRKKGDKVSVFPDSPQEYALPFYNHKDGISIKAGDQIGYNKAMECLKLKCQVVKNTIGWMDESEWTLGIINIGSNPFYFLIKTEFKPEDDSDRSDGSAQSHRTRGRQKSEHSNGHKIDPLAKTVRNMNVVNLKKSRNDLVQ